MFVRCQQIVVDRHLEQAEIRSLRGQNSPTQPIDLVAFLLLPVAALYVSYIKLSNRAVWGHEQ